MAEYRSEVGRWRKACIEAITHPNSACLYFRPTSSVRASLASMPLEEMEEVVDRASLREMRFASCLQKWMIILSNSYQDLPCVTPHQHDCSGVVWGQVNTQAHAHTQNDTHTLLHTSTHMHILTHTRGERERETYTQMDSRDNDLCGQALVKLTPSPCGVVRCSAPAAGAAAPLVPTIS